MTLTRRGKAEHKKKERKMPFEKVVITHKFGIISQTHKKQLQERLLERREQLYNQAKKRDKKDENM